MTNFRCYGRFRRSPEVRYIEGEPHSKYCLTKVDSVDFVALRFDCVFFLSDVSKNPPQCFCSCQVGCMYV